MFAFLLLFALCHSECDEDKNKEPLLMNEDCNWVGRCAFNECYCCDSRDPSSFCENDKLSNPGHWETGPDGKPCGTLYKYYLAEWGYLYPSGFVNCPNDRVSPANPDYIDETIAVLRTNYDYNGTVLPQPCKVCTEDDPCTLLTGSPTTGIFVKFGTDLNTYYNESCGTGTLPYNYIACTGNWDNGASAAGMIGRAFDAIKDHKNHIYALNEELKQIVVTAAYQTTKKIITEVFQASLSPTPLPTFDPTIYPTRSPTELDIKEEKCKSYRNEEKYIKFLGGGSSCRANINESWTGGRTCSSPYIICLPQENTPSLNIRGTPYFNDTHRYSVLQCKQECADDQRCMGFEFVADTASNRGNCTLLDDIPIKIENPNIGFQYSEIEDDLTTEVEALCFVKSYDDEESCNPSIEAKHYLNDTTLNTMLNCYCPNNRKGSYTKRVKRTVAATRYCYNDPSVEERIRKAQAHRMFHLCENWCLFDTLNPEQESWYWDPWKQCYRETYSAVGAHTGYCDRVIRNPNSIEFQFVTYRKEHFCGVTEQPTSSPVSASIITWTLSDIEESCDEACSRTGARCAAHQTMRVFSKEEELLSAFEKAGVTCQEVIMNSMVFEGWALPGNRDSLCVNRQPTLTHLSDLSSDCNRKLGGEWRRLCACY